MSAETSTVDLSKEGGAPEEDTDTDKSATAKGSATPLTDAQAQDFCEWLKITLGKKVSTVKVTKRLSDSPAIVTDHESGALRRMLKMVVSPLFLFC